MNAAPLKAYTDVPTYQNTEFPAWWKSLNAECVKRGLPEVGFSDALGSYEMGESPETAAAYLEGMG